MRLWVSTLYQARGVISHVIVCVVIDMTTHSSGSIPTHTYINDYSLLWFGTGSIHTHIYTWLLTPLARYPHTYIYMTTHSSGSIPTHTHDLYQARVTSSHVYMCVTLYQARGVSSHVYMCVGIRPEEWVVMCICVWFWYRVTHIYTWLLTPLAWYPHTYIHDY
jgi:hypothetical protein